MCVECNYLKSYKIIQFFNDFIFKIINRGKKNKMAIITNIIIIITILQIYLLNKNSRGKCNLLLQDFSEWSSPRKNFVIQFLLEYPFSIIIVSIFS